MNKRKGIFSNISDVLCLARNIPGDANPKDIRRLYNIMEEYVEILLRWDFDRARVYVKMLRQQMFEIEYLVKKF